MAGWMVQDWFVGIRKNPMTKAHLFCLDLAGWGELLRRLQAAASAVSAPNHVHSATNRLRNRKRKRGLPWEEPRMARAPHPQKPAAVVPS